MSDPRVAVVIVSYNTRELTLEAVASALDARGVETEVWVVDNASGDGSADAVRARHARVRVMASPRNLGFARGNNLALAEVDAPWVLLLNADARFAAPEGLRGLVAALERRPDAALVGPRLEDPHGALEFSVRAFPSVAGELLRGTGLHHLLPAAARRRLLAYEFHDHAAGGEADWVTGACMLVRGPVLREVGGFDPAFFLFAEEMELCWRLRRAGWEVLFDPGVTVVHHRGASGGGESSWKLRLAFAGEAYAVRKHRGSVYLAAFAVSRCLGLAATILVQGALRALTGDAARGRRARGAARALGAWVRVMAWGGARDPGAARWLPGAGGGAA